MFQLQLRGLGEDRTTPGKFCKFYSHSSLKTVFPVLRVTQNCYMNIKITSWKLVLLSLLQTPCLKKYIHNLKKYEIKWTSKIPISQLFSELEKTWKFSLALYLHFSIFFLNQEILRSLARATFKISKISLKTEKNLDLLPGSNTQKSKLLIYG